MRMLSSPPRSIWPSRLAMPFKNTSAPISPISGWCSACQAACSPPPKPISSQYSFLGSENRLAGSSLPPPSSGSGMASRGSSWSTRPCPVIRSFLPRRRPKNRRTSGKRRLQAVDQIQLLPREAAIGFRLAAEMAVSGGAGVDRLVEAEMGADAARGQIHQLLQHVGQLVLVDMAGAEGVDIDRERLGNADRVAELDHALLGQAGTDHVLGQIARDVSRRAVDLGRILAREGAAAMGCRAAIGVDDDLAPGQAAIAVGTADDETPRGIDVEGLLRAHPALGQHIQHMRTDDLAHGVLV